MKQRPVHALVLAGGKSRRMGQDKAHIVHAGKPRLAHTVDLLAPLVDKVWVSVRKDQPADPLRDAYPQIVDRELRVLDDIVQDSGHQTLVVETHAREDTGNRDRVIDVGFARKAFLVDMRIRAVEIGPVDLADLDR